MSPETFIPKSGDVMICTPPKCGTTLMQQVWQQMQIVQSLRTGGDLSFEEISLVIPFIELHRSFGIEDLDAPQPGCLRAFKTHHRQPSCPGGFRDDVKYIYVMRDPIEVDDFVTRSFLAKGESGGPSTPHHLLSWYPFRSAPNMLFLFYEDLVQHKQACVELVAAFLGIPQEEALLEVAVQQSSKEAMAASLSKYDDHPFKQRHNPAVGLAKDAGNGQGKVRVAPKAVLSSATVAAMRRRWEEVVGPVTGCSTYETFRAKTNAELGRPF